MKRFYPAWAAALALALGCARAGAAAIPGEDLFKWGEYDSLIRILEPKAETGEARNHVDSLEKAKSLLFLGVAYSATGKPERADEVFTRAVELDPNVELDRYYVTEAIASRFQATALRALRKRPPPSATAARSQTPPPEPPLPSPAIVPPAHHHAWVWAGVGTVTALAAFAGGYYFFADRGGAREDVTRIDLSRP